MWPMNNNETKIAQKEIDPKMNGIIINDTVDNHLSSIHPYEYFILINYNEYFVASCSNQVSNFSNANQVLLYIRSTNQIFFPLISWYLNKNIVRAIRFGVM